MFGRPVAALDLVGAGPAGLGVDNDQVDVHDAVGFRISRELDLGKGHVGVLGVEQLQRRLGQGDGDIGQHDEAVTGDQRTGDAELDQGAMAFDHAADTGKGARQVLADQRIDRKVAGQRAGNRLAGGTRQRRLRDVVIQVIALLHGLWPPWPWVVPSKGHYGTNDGSPH